MMEKMTSLKFDMGYSPFPLCHLGGRSRLRICLIAGYIRPAPAQVLPKGQGPPLASCLANLATATTNVSTGVEDCRLPGRETLRRSSCQF